MAVLVYGVGRYGAKVWLMLMRVFDMLPDLTGHNFADSPPADTIRGGNRGVCFSGLNSLANIAHGVIGQLSVRPLFAARNQLGMSPRSMPVSTGNTFRMETHPMLIAGSGAIPFNLVAHVVGVRALINVLRIAARRIIASVTAVRLWPESVGQEKGDTMCSLVAGSVSAADGELAVPASVERRSPWPTGIGSIRAINLRPKTFNLLRGILGAHFDLLSRVPCPRLSQAARGFLHDSILPQGAS